MRKNRHANMLNQVLIFQSKRATSSGKNTPRNSLFKFQMIIVIL